MTARTRARPRAASKPRASRRRKSFFSKAKFIRAEFAGLAIALGALAALWWLVDTGEVLSETRDWFVRTFGLGIFVLAALSILGGWAIANRKYEHLALFARQTGGVLAFGVFAWGLLGLNEADWSMGGVSFAEVSLGGEVGQGLTQGPLETLAWLSLLVVGSALVAPRLTMAFARNAPVWAATAWERRYPHRAARGVGRFLRFILRHPHAPQADDFVIGGTLRQRLDPAIPAAMEEPPRVFRPGGDAAAVGSLLGAGAAATFAREAFDDDEPAAFRPENSDIDDEDFDGPQQLGLELGSAKGWQLPAIEMLNAPQPSLNRKHDNAARAQLIVDTLSSFGVDATVVEINEGPTVTQFGVEPGWEVRHKDVPLRDESGRTLFSADGRPRAERVEVGRTRVRVNKITALQNDLALALAAPSLRIEAPVPGRAIVGIEVPNDSATVVTMRNVMETKEFQELSKRTKLALALGKGVSGTAVVADLAKMPHLLIAGATGSGKSVCMNSIIAGLMMNASPEQVRFVMIDPKRVELTAFKSIPHLAFSDVIVDMDKVVGTLQAVVREMEGRYKKLEAMAVRNVESYNRHPRVLIKMPYWVVIIDELADLMMAAPFEVEKLLCRLAQLARATGIHLVVATQRPSVDVVTGLIKANFPTRIAFAVTSMTDSRTILDTGGAEKLLGRGDMLYMPTDAAKPIRIQGVYVSDAEVERLVAFWTDERFKTIVPENADELLEQALTELHGGEADIEMDEDDPIVERARKLALQHHRVSPSLFQRRLRVGYMKAAKLIEILEEDGIVGPREVGDSRRVLVTAGSDDGDW